MYGCNINSCNSFQVHFNIPVLCLLFIFTNDLEYVVINEIAVTSIYCKLTVVGNIFKSISQFYFIQESDI